MPESPEVKIITEQLKTLEGKYIQDIYFLYKGRYYITPPVGFKKFTTVSEINYFKIKEINCKGKFIYWKLESHNSNNLNNLNIANTLGMTGSWSYTHDDYGAAKFTIGNLSKNEDYKNYDLNQPFAIYFRDIRHFGTLKFIDDIELSEKLNSLGPDMLASPPSKEVFYNIIHSSKIDIARTLMNQSNISGIGNYLKSEILYDAKVSPWRICSSLSLEEIENIRLSTIKIIQKSYSLRGATLANYTDINGKKGNFSDYLTVYKKKICPLGYLIKKETTLDKRSTFWVPELQK